VLRNATIGAVDVTLANGQTKRIDAEDDATFVIRREDFPSAVRVVTLEGTTVLEREIAYDFLARSEFRVSFDENGFFPTTVVRATPVRETPAP
jgi:hypothetical protein